MFPEPWAAPPTSGLSSRTGVGHEHSLSSQRGHVRATHVRVSKVNIVPRSEPCVVEQRLNVGEVWVVVEEEQRQAHALKMQSRSGERGQILSTAAQQPSIGGSPATVNRPWYRTSLKRGGEMSERFGFCEGKVST